MGSKSVEGEADESPPHTVQVHGFYMDKYEVTRDEYEHVMGTNPSTGPIRRRPRRSSSRRPVARRGSRSTTP